MLIRSSATIHAVEVFIDREQVRQAVLGQLLGLAGRELLAALMDDVAGLGVDQVMARLGALPLLGVVGSRQPSVGLFVGQRVVIGARISSASMPRALSSDVTGILRRRSIRANTTSLASNSISSHEPR